MRSGSGKQGTVRERRAEQELGATKSGPLSNFLLFILTSASHLYSVSLIFPSLKCVLGPGREMGTGLANF